MLLGMTHRVRNGPYMFVIPPPEYPGKRYRGKYAYEHRVVYWQTHGVLPGPGEVVHHKNDTKRDNDPDNLDRLTVAAHNAEHHSKPITHGNPGGYRRGCRCESCTTANTLCQQRWRQKRREKAA